FYPFQWDRSSFGRSTEETLYSDSFRRGPPRGQNAPAGLSHAPCRVTRRALPSLKTPGQPPPGRGRPFETSWAAGQNAAGRGGRSSSDPGNRPTGRLPSPARRTATNAGLAAVERVTGGAKHLAVRLGRTRLEVVVV